MGALIKRLARGLRNAGLTVLFLAMAGVGLAVFQSMPQTVDSRAGSDGWGAESLAEVHERVSGFSIIGIANACGLGASSCFKCHNGTRAAAPNEDSATAPWHAEHRTVNNSCAGCHSGNPRIIRKEMAHNKLIANPRTTPAESCASCHASEVEPKMARYLNVMGSKQ
ncbi:MAG: hypothetical protein AB7U81_04850 [Thiohalomonadaceae bacterium]